MKGYLEAIKLNLENRTLTKKILADYSAVTDDELLDIAYDAHILKIRNKVPYPRRQRAGRCSSTSPRAIIRKFATSRSTRFLTIASSANWTRVGLSKGRD
jgi:hypothetical protein